MRPARAGEIVLDAQTEQDVAHIAETESVGPLSLRGFQQPVAAFRLKALKTRADLSQSRA